LDIGFFSGALLNLKLEKFLEANNKKARAEITLGYRVELRDGRIMEDQVTGNVEFVSDGDWKISKAESLQVFK